MPNSISMLGLFGIGPSFWDYVMSLFSTIPKLAYMLWASCMSVLDVLQLFMRKIAGLDVYYVNGEPQRGDIVSNFLDGIFGFNGVKYPALQTAFWSLIILGLILLVLATIIAIIRSEYTTDKDKSGSKSKYVGAALKALAEFAIIPIACIFGIWLSNIVLQALDSATQYNTNIATGLDTSKLKPYDEGKGIYSGYDFFGWSGPCSYTTFSGVAFQTAAYNANRVRTGFYSTTNFSTFDLFKSNTGNADDVAFLIDVAFANNLQLKNPGTLDRSGPAGTVCLNACDILTVGYVTPVKSFSKFDAAKVWYYYDLWKFDFLVGFAILLIMAKLFIDIIFGLAKRIFELVGLFIISPPIIALRPLDNGGAVDKWKKSFISKTISAYGAVVGMNIFFLIFPYVNEINFFDIPIVDNLISSIMIIVGLMSVKGFIGLLAGFVGAEDASAEGGKISGEVGKTVAKAGMLAAGAMTGGAALVGGVAKAAGGAAFKGINKIRDKGLDDKIKKKQENAKKANSEMMKKSRKPVQQMRRIDNAYNEAYQNARKHKKSKKDAELEANQAFRAQAEKEGMAGKFASIKDLRKDKAYSEYTDALKDSNKARAATQKVEAVKDAGGYSAYQRKKVSDAGKAVAKGMQATGRVLNKVAKGAGLTAFGKAGLAFIGDAKGAVKDNGFSDGYKGGGGTAGILNKMVTPFVSDEAAKKKKYADKIKDEKEKQEIEKLAGTQKASDELIKKQKEELETLKKQVKDLQNDNSKKK